MLKIQIAGKEQSFRSIQELIQFSRAEIQRIDSELSEAKKKIKELKQARKELSACIDEKQASE